MPGGALANGTGEWLGTGAENGGITPVPGSAAEVEEDGDGCSSWGAKGCDRLPDLDDCAGEAVDSIDSMPRGDGTAFAGAGGAAGTSAGAPCEFDDGGGRAGAITCVGVCGCIDWLVEPAGESIAGGAGAGAGAGAGVVAARGAAFGADTGAGVVDFGVGGLDVGVGGGGIAPFGGPYCRMGRDAACCAGLLGSLMAYMVASK